MRSAPALADAVGDANEALLTKRYAGASQARRNGEPVRIGIMSSLTIVSEITRDETREPLWRFNSNMSR
jgi:hypothetical protein